MPYIGNNQNVGDHVNNFKVLDDISSYTATFNGSAASVVSTTNETIRVADHRFIQGQRVTYSNGGGSNIGGLTSGTAYYVSFDSVNTIKLATSLVNANNNTVINLSSVGSGSSHTLTAAFDGVNTEFKLTYGGKGARLSNAAQLNVAVNNVVQRPNLNPLSFTEGFSVKDGNKIIFQSAPEVNDVFWGSIISNTIDVFDVEDNAVDNFTGDGSTTNFTLSTIPPNKESILVTLDGVVQHPSDNSTTRAYTINASVVVFTSAPASGVAIQVRHIGFASPTAPVRSFYGRTGNVTLTSSDHITTGDITSRNINSSGIITASSFSGTFSGAISGTTISATSATFSGDVSIGGTLTYEDVKNVDSVGFITARSGILVQDDATFTGAVGNMVFDKSDSALEFGDGLKASFGNSSDLEIYHTSDVNYIDCTNNFPLRLQSNDFRLRKQDGGEEMITAAANGTVRLYYNGEEKLSTIDKGIRVGTGVTIETNGQANFVGVTTFGNLVGGATTSVVVNRDLVLRDAWGYGNHVKFHYGNNTLNFPSASLANIGRLPKLSFGDRTTTNILGVGDFIMYHDFYNMHMRYYGANGNLVLSNKNTEIHISGANGSGNVQQSIRIKPGSTEGVILHHGGNAKFETAGIGASVYGTLVATGADVNGDLDVDGHTNLDNVSISGVVTATTYKGDGSQLTGIVAGLSTVSGVVNVANDLDVDGHTNLDNVSIAGVTTFSGAINSSANITTTLDLNSRYLYVKDIFMEDVSPELRFTDTDNNPNYRIRLNSGLLGIRDITNNVDKLVFNTSGMVATGIVTATSFSGSGANLTGISIASDAQRNTVGGTNAGDSFSGTDATDNTILGYDAGTSLTTGDNNVIIGAYAAKSVTTIGNFVAIGHSAYSSQVSSNGGTVAIGRNALKTYTGDFGQVAIGQGAGQDAGNSGGNNTLIGENAGYGCKGFSSVIVGYHAGSASNTQGGETIIGMQARYFGNNKAGNTAVGKEAMKGVSGGNGSHTTAIGYEALKVLNNGGNQNTALGYQAGDKVNTGTSNVIIGYSAASTGTNDLTNGSNNIIIGKDAAASSATVSNEITFGDSNINHLRVPGIGVSFSEGGAVIAGVVTATNFVKADGSSVGNDLTSVTSNIVPDSDNARDLGTSSARWNELYIQSIKGNQNQHIFYDANGAIEMFAKSTQFIGMKVNGKGLEIRNNSRVIPTTSGVINFGDATNKWNEIHANSFHGSGANLTGINADLVNDSSPQLGGDLDTNSHHILLDDDHEVKFGANSDIRIFHANGNANFIQSYNDVDFRIHTFGTSAKLRLQVNESENSVVCTPNGPTELYYDNEMMFRTNQDGSEFFDSDNNCNVYFTCNGTRRGYIFVDSTNGGKMSFYDNQDHPMLSATKNGTVDLYYDNAKALATASTGVKVYGGTSSSNGTIDIYPTGSAVYSILNLHNAAGNSNAQLIAGSGSSVYLGSGGSGDVVLRTGNSQNKVIGKHNGAVELYHSSNKKLETVSTGIQVTGNVKANGISQTSGNLSVSNNDTSNGVITFATNTNDCWRMEFNGDFEPHVDNNVNIGSPSKRVANIYTTDLQLSNKGSQNDVDGTWGDYTIQEGENDLFLINNRSGKKYKFNLTEVS